MVKEQTCCVTGHRDLTPNQQMAAVVKLMGEILTAGADGYVTFITGMAKGTDLIFAEDVLLLKKRAPFQVELVAAISHRGALGSRDPEFQELIRRCDRVEVLSEFYHPGVYAQRNRWMLERSSRLIAAYDGRGTGGTVQTMREAEKMGVEIRRVDLDSLGPEQHLLNYIQ